MKFTVLHKRLLIAGISSLALAACVPATSINHEDANHADMSMQDMTDGLADETGDAFDKAFLETMIVHHQGAIDMARAAQQKAKHPEIKDMADDIISTQQGEINQMKQWMKDWGYEN